MPISRRLFLQGLLSTGAAACLGQGVASRKVPTQPRPKPSGLPFGSRLTDVAATAGLSSVTIYGHEDHNDYLLEAIGCGCAFLDYRR